MSEKINYIEIPCKDMASTKLFFEKVFDWAFEDYGPEYSAFFNAGIDGGIYLSDQTVSANNGSVLVVFYSEDLENIEQIIKSNGGEIVQPVFDFPGGRRFHFIDPSGNEFAVWSDVNV